MKKLIIVLMVLVSLVFAGCGDKKDVGSDSFMGYTVHFTTKQGVDCVFTKYGYSGGLSCNWEKYNKQINR